MKDVSQADAATASKDKTNILHRESVRWQETA